MIYKIFQTFVDSSVLVYDNKHMDNIETIAGDTMTFIKSLSVDVSSFLVFVAIFIIIGIRAGKRALISLILSIYVSIILLMIIPFSTLIQHDFGLILGKFSTLNVVLLLITLGVVHYLIGDTIELEFSSGKFYSLLETLFLSALSGALLISALYITDSVVATSGSLSILDTIFTNQYYLSIILVLPLAGIFLSTRS